MITDDRVEEYYLQCEDVELAGSEIDMAAVEEVALMLNIPRRQVIASLSRSGYSS